MPIVANTLKYSLEPRITLSYSRHIATCNILLESDWTDSKIQYQMAQVNVLCRSKVKKKAANISAWNIPRDSVWTDNV